MAGDLIFDKRRCSKCGQASAFGSVVGFYLPICQHKHVGNLSGEGG